MIVSSVRGFWKTPINFGWNTIRRYKQHWLSSDQHLNIIKNLQTHLDVPVFSEEEEIFRPSKDEFDKFVYQFNNEVKHKLKFKYAVANYNKFPDEQTAHQPEIAILGRSNVGKSSFLSTILKHSIADVIISVSKNPGHTKSLKFFKIGKLMTLVDTPGYGFRMPKYYKESVERYLCERERLIHSILLIDSSFPLSDMDRTGIKMMEQCGKPYSIVMTKVDKCSEGKAITHLFLLKEYIREHTEFASPQPFLVSSTTEDGIDFIKSYLISLTQPQS